MKKKNDDQSVRSQLDDELTHRMNHLALADDMMTQVVYLIWGAAVTTTRAFEKVTVEIEPATNRILVKIRLRWWARFSKFRRLKTAWLRHAERRCQEHAPTGWRVQSYFES